MNKRHLEILADFVSVDEELLSIIEKAEKYEWLEKELDLVSVDEELLSIIEKAEKYEWLEKELELDKGSNKKVNRIQCFLWMNTFFKYLEETFGKGTFQKIYMKRGFIHEEKSDEVI